MTRCELHGADEDHCPGCYADDVARATQPRRTLTQDLAELETVDPEVAAAAHQLDDTKKAIGRRGIARARAALADSSKPAPTPDQPAE